MYRLIDHPRIVADTVSDLHDDAREIAWALRQDDGQAWTTLRFEEVREGRIVGEGSFNVESAVPMNTVWYWRE
jgi:hypothetical protein